MRQRARQRRVLVVILLRARAGEVEADLVARLRHGAPHLERARAPHRGRVRPRAPGAIRKLAQLRARETLAVLDQLPHRRLDELEAELLHQPQHARAAHVVRGDAGPQIELDVVRVAALLDDGLADVVAELTALHDLERADAETLVVDLGRRAAEQPARVGGVRAAGGPADEPALGEDRHHHHLVIGVRPRDVRVVVEDLVALMEPWRAAELADEELDRVARRRGETQVPRAREDHPAARVVEGLHAFATLHDDRGGRYALQRRASFLADHPEAVTQDLVPDRIDDAHDADPFASMARFPNRSTSALIPAGTTTVVKADSTTAGPPTR